MTSSSSNVHQAPSHPVPALAPSKALEELSSFQTPQQRGTNMEDALGEKDFTPAQRY